MSFFRVEKGWGHEEWIDNRKEYCGKLLFFNKGKICSWHFHLEKTETFGIYYGKVMLKYGFDSDITKAEEIILNPGDKFFIPRELKHRIIALENSMIFEISTFHRDEDSYRIIKGD